MTNQPNVLDYGRPAKQPVINPRGFLTGAYVCGCVPLVAGVTITIAYVISYNRSLPAAGFITLLCGLIAFVIGGVSWLIYVVRTLHLKSRRWWLKTAGALLLLLANFPVCAACLWASGLWRFTVVNNSQTPTTVTITSQSAGTRNIGLITGHSREQRYWHLGSVGDTFTVTTTAGGTSSTTSFDIYAGGSSGGEDLVITINPNGTLTTP